MTEKTSLGISRATFIAGLIIAVLASSALSTVIATQWAIVQGPKGDKGDPGPEGPQGPQGEQGLPGVFTVENLSGWLPTPAYDSGWIYPFPNVDTTIRHGLNTKEVFVYLIGRDDAAGIHQVLYGERAFWKSLSDNEIVLVRSTGDTVWDQGRVLIWRLSGPPVIEGEVDAVDVVDRVIDGDTFDTTEGDRIRLADVNAPESGQNGSAEATDFLISLVGGKTVYLDIDDVYGTDPYGRLVCVVYVEYNSTHVKNVNKALLVEGHAWIWEFDNEFYPYTWSLYYVKEAISGFP